MFTILTNQIVFNVEPHCKSLVRPYHWVIWCTPPLQFEKSLREKRGYRKKTDCPLPQLNTPLAGVSLNLFSWLGTVDVLPQIENNVYTVCPRSLFHTYVATRYSKMDNIVWTNSIPTFWNIRPCFNKLKASFQNSNM